MNHYVNLAGKAAVDKAPEFVRDKAEDIVDSEVSKGKRNVYVLMIILYVLAYIQLLFNTVSLTGNNDEAHYYANLLAYFTTLGKMYFYSYYSLGIEIYVFNDGKRLNCFEWACCTTCYAMKSLCCCYCMKLSFCSNDENNYKELMNQYDPYLLIYNKWKWRFCIIGVIDALVEMYAAVGGSDISPWGILGAIVSVVGSVVAVKSQWAEKKRAKMEYKNSQDLLAVMLCCVTFLFVFVFVVC